MSDIRFNRWLHQSGTGGVYQASSGNIGIGTSVPSTTLDVNGSISATSITATTGTITGNLSVGGVLTYEDVTNIDAVGVVTARAGVKIPDSQKIFLGTDDDLEIYYDGTNSRIYNNTGELVIRNSADNKSVYIQTDDSSGGVDNYILCEGSSGKVRLYHYGSEKLQTKSDGVDITGELQSDSLDVDGIANIQSVLTMQSYIQGTTTLDLYGDSSASQGLSLDASGNVTLQANLDLQDNDKILLGNGDDLQIYHNGTDSYVRDTATGSLILTGNRVIIKNAADNARMIDAVEGGAVKLLYNNVEKLETTSAGIKVSGSFPDITIHDTDTTNDNFRILHNGGGTQLLVDPNNVGPNASHFIVGIDGTERLRVDNGGKILVGPGAIATPKCGNAGIDIPNYDWSIIMGGSDGNGNRANNANKDGRFAGAHYVNAEEPVGIIRCTSGASANELHMGGGSSLINAATQLSFYTAANTTTTGGTERLRITSGGEITSGNLRINAYAHQNTPSGYSQYQSDNHSNTLFGQNLKLGTNGSSGNHQIEIINQHSTIGGAGMYMGGNGSNQENAINFYAESANQSAGTDVTANRRAQIGSSAFFTWVEPRNLSGTGMSYLRTFGFTFNLQDGETETVFYNPDGYRRIYYQMYFQSGHGSNGYGYILANISRYGMLVHDVDWHVSYTSYAFSGSVGGNVNHNGIKFTRSGYSNTNITYYVIVKAFSPAGGNPYSNSGLTDPSYRYFNSGY